MFDIGFGEFLLVAVVALVVVGPARLPQTARFVGHLYGRLQRQINQARSDIRREMAMEDMRSIRRECEDAARGARDALGGVDRAVREEAREIESAASLAPGSASPWPPAPSPSVEPPAAPAAAPKS